MTKFFSEVMEPQKREKRKTRGFMRAALIYSITVGALLGGTIYVANQEKTTQPETNQASSCGKVIPRSVFTTGSPLLDQQILWAISNDASEGREVSARLVTHIWESKNFAFETVEENKLWEQATGTVQQVSQAINKPALMLAEGNVIVPYNDNPQTQGLSWQEVQVTPAYEVGTMLAGPNSEQSEASVVPIVFMPINSGQIIPAPSYDDSKTVQIVDYKGACDA